MNHELKCKTINFFEIKYLESSAKQTFDLKAQSIKEKIDKLDLIKIKNFCFAKDHV